MKLSLQMITVVVASVFVSGCGSVDSQYFRSGIGTDLSYSSLPAQTQIQDLYVQHICRQAGVNSCGSTNWNAFVEAGMNDIDQRCDSYLAWLDNRRRSTGPILQQIGDTQSATEAILLASGVGATAIGVVGAAFGFARDTFNNFNSRLILEVNHSTVQTIVLSGQTRFREALRGKIISDQPQAIYALRQYLRICMPFTIENEINTTITTFERGGPEALANRNRAPLIATATIGSEPVTPRLIVAPRPYSPPPLSQEYAQILVSPTSKYSSPQIRRILTKLCIPPNEVIQNIGMTNARIEAFQQWRIAVGDKIEITGKLSEQNLAVASGPDVKNCDLSRYSNAYEVAAFPNGLNNDEGLVDAMNKVLVKGNKEQLKSTPTLAALRLQLPVVRNLLKDKLKLIDSNFEKQVTEELADILAKE